MWDELRRKADNDVMQRVRHLLLLLREVWAYAWQNKAWWIVPAVLVLLFLSLLIVVASSTAPIIYTLF